MISLISCTVLLPATSIAFNPNSRWCPSPVDDNDVDDEEDEFGEDDNIFDEDEFDGSYTYDNE